MHTEIENELGDLANCDVLLPPDADAARALEVIPVHDNVNGQVQGDDRPGNRGVADKLGVAEHSGCAMVVGVEGGWILLDDAQYRILKGTYSGASS